MSRERLVGTIRHQFREDVSSKNDLIVTHTEKTRARGVDMRRDAPPVRGPSGVVAFSVMTVLICIETLINSELRSFYPPGRKHNKTVKEMIKNNCHSLDQQVKIHSEAKRLFSKKFSLRDVLRTLSKPNCTGVVVNSFSRVHDTGYHKTDNKRDRRAVLDTIKAVLATGTPVITVMRFPKGFYKSKNGVVYQHKASFDAPVVVVGFSDHTKCLIFQGFFGRGWGDNGYGYMPFSLFLKRSIKDTWVITDLERSDGIRSSLYERMSVLKIETNTTQIPHDNHNNVVKGADGGCSQGETTEVGGETAGSSGGGEKETAPSQGNVYSAQRQETGCCDGDSALCEKTSVASCCQHRSGYDSGCLPEAVLSDEKEPQEACEEGC